MSFNIRVYGLLVNDNGEILIVEEHVKGIRTAKFPGGGLEFGEGIRDALKREISEELQINLQPGSHYYTTDFFVQSVFDSEDQVISVYYRMDAPSDLSNKYRLPSPESLGNKQLHFQWRKISDLDENDFLMPVDRYVIKKIKNDRDF